MSVEILREAAAKMREVAQRAAAQSEAEVGAEGVWLNSRFYMTADPDFMLAVADLLEADASHVERNRLAITFDGAPMFPPNPHAIAVATTYLGGAR